METYGIIWAFLERERPARRTQPKTEKRMTKMTIEEAYKGSKLAKAVEDAKLGHVFLQKQNAVMIHDTDYTPDPKTDAEKAEMRDWVKQIMEKVLGAPLAREVNVLVDPNAGARGYKCYCTSATYVVAFDELTAA